MGGTAAAAGGTWKLGSSDGKPAKPVGRVGGATASAKKRPRDLSLRRASCTWRGVMRSMDCPRAHSQAGPAGKKRRRKMRFVDEGQAVAQLLGRGSRTQYEPYAVL